MVLKPDSEFFRYFVDPTGRPQTGAPRAPAAPSSGTAGAGQVR
jgi:hypothetical protein